MHFFFVTSKHVSCAFDKFMNLESILIILQCSALAHEHDLLNPNFLASPQRVTPTFVSQDLCYWRACTAVVRFSC